MTMLTPYAVWTREFLGLDPARLAELGATVESLGYGAVWMPGGQNDAQPVLATADGLLSGTTRLVAATGVMNIWRSPAPSTGPLARTLIKEREGRFILGVGVSHPEALGDLFGPEWTPMRAMRAYLDELDKAGVGKDNRMIAALGPAMLRLAGERAAGTHPYHSTPEHTAAARAALGKGPFVVPEQSVVLDSNPSSARQTAREHLGLYMKLGNYVRNWLRHGLDESDLADGGSDRLIDALVAWGDEAAIARRVREHLDAGADQVAIQVLGASPVPTENGEPPVETWRRLAPALAG